jgi:hypothetical protein
MLWEISHTTSQGTTELGNNLDPSSSGISRNLHLVGDFGGLKTSANGGSSNDCEEFGEFHFVV